MHIRYHEVIAAIGGILFIIIGFARRRERLRLLKEGKKPEGAMVWISLIIVGILLLMFAAGVIFYQNR